MIAVPTPLPPAAVHAVLAVTALSAVFAAKHVAADFLLQSNWMARGKEGRDGWLAPLLAHVGCHAALTLLIALAVAPGLWGLALVDFAVHTAVDRAKALATLRLRPRMDQPLFWWLLGLDQGLHQVTNIGLAAALVLL